MTRFIPADHPNCSTVGHARKVAAAPLPKAGGAPAALPLRRGIALAAIVLALAGCGPTAWQKPGATAQDLNDDQAACQAGARQGGYSGNGPAAAIDKSNLYNRCMVAHGWSVNRTEAASAASAKAD